MAVISLAFLAYIAIFVFTVLIGFFCYFKHCHKYWAKLGVPTRPTHFFYGNLKNEVTLKTTLGEEIVEWYREHKSKGHKYLGLYFFNIPSFMPIDPELVKCIMSKDFDHFVDRGFFYNEESDPLSAHLFSLEGAKWKNLRQKLSPTFTSGKLKKMFQTLVDCGDELKDCLDEFEIKDEPVDIKNVLAKYTTDVIGSCAFGIECNSFKNSDSDFIKYGTKIFRPPLFERIKMFFSILFPPVSRFLGLSILGKDVDYFFRKLVKDTIEYRENNNITRNDFMQLLMQLKNKGALDDEAVTHKQNPNDTLTLKEVAAQSFVFFIAGYETSSTTMAFSLYLLAKNPDIQDKSREDIVNVLKKHDGKITYDSIMDMHYLERVIQETLRIYPPLTVLQRKVTKDYNIPQTNIILKKGVVVFVPVLGLHTDPEYFPDPDRFNPERFEEKHKVPRPDFTYLPFGDGPRICIGLRFGMMQTKVGLCRLLSHYRFTLSSKTNEPLKMDPSNFVLGVKDGIWLNVQKI